jgi:hypothetical protein
MTTVHTFRPSSPCRRPCPASVLSPEQHDRLLRVDVDQEVQLELLETAVTWHELEYSEVPVIGPREWLTFAATHRWTLPERAERVFSLAVDVAGRRTAGPPPEPEAAPVLELVPR